MRAIRVSKAGGPDVLQLEGNLPVPIPGDNQVQVQVKAVGINPVEVYVRNGKWMGKMIYDDDDTRSVQNFPYTPGSDAAGIITAVGADVKNLQVGDRVYTCTSVGSSGSYAEYMLAPADRVFHLPEQLSFSQGAALGIPYFTALRSLKHKAHVQAGQSVLVHGASGGVGLATCQIAKYWGLDVVGTASTDAGAELVRAAGARLVLNHKDKNHKQNLLDATGGKGFDVIMEMFGDLNLQLDLDVSAVKGHIVLIGGRGKSVIDPWAIMGREVKVDGVLRSLATDAEWAEMAADLAQAMKDGAINPIIDAEFILPLEKAPEAHKAIMEHVSGSKGKIVLIP
ncbi:Quinone oxidoreductase [Hypsibius exemplaris]|uniref:Quinone oxidoreductase n=1 Tax=Hypsibius exemplaris TaxID=2072580 RepID=A0A1W0WWT1_HYPEX|nr:Quinone oxidoreductase [Hypsibius exemplaris]